MPDNDQDQTLPTEECPPETEATPTPPPPPPARPHPGAIALHHGPQTFRFTEMWPDWDPDFFITAGHPGLEEETIVNTTIEYIAKAGVKKPSSIHDFDQVVHYIRGFIAKCHEQITDFCLPVMRRDEATGELAEAKQSFDAAHPAQNEVVYKAMAFTADLRVPVEAFLDAVAQRSPEAQAAFESLKNSPSAS
jgi:hypothetical protein